MRLLGAWLSVLPVLIIVVTDSSSHHAFSPVYDEKRLITIVGVVIQFKFVNPHAMMSMDVADEPGKVLSWTVEFAGRLNLSEVGWCRVHQDRRAGDCNR